MGRADSVSALKKLT